jgi:hypothetical protein
MNHRSTCAFAAAFAAITLAAASGQPTAPAQPSGSAPSQQGADAAAQAPPPAVRLGLRAENVRRRLGVLPIVVVVPDGASYAAAVSGWSLERRYPVLIDDGSWRARQDIARFVRAFGPRDVVRWQRPTGADGAAPPAWPSEPAARREIIATAAARAMGAKSAADLKARYTEVSLEPFGVVVTNDADPAWTAGLALAAGRCQPIVFINHGSAGKAVPESLTQEGALGLIDDVEKAVGGLGYTWDKAGDQIDAVTLCLNVPGKVGLPSGDKRVALALTDLLGRGPGGLNNRLWAWSGQVFGNEAQAAYRAMSGLFITPTRAWLFDGYESGPPWNGYDMTATAADLTKAGLAVEVHDTPKQGLDDWRIGAARVGTPAKDSPVVFGVDAELIAVNSMGMPETFELRPGQAKAADVPVLARPALVWFVHSFSASHVYNPGTIAGRFFQNGAFAYIGSVHEPTLGAFVPTPLLMRRMLVGYPLAAAVRMDGNEQRGWADPWKVGVFGDPLVCLGPPAPRAEGELPLTGSVSLTAKVAEDVKAKRFEDAVVSLALLGRDRDVARLAAALAAEKNPAWNPAVARAAFGSLFFTGDTRTMALAYTLAAPAGDASAMPGAMDMVWHALFPTLRTSRPEEAAALRAAIRWDVNMRDGAEAFFATKAAEGDSAARAFADTFRKTLPNDEARTAFEGLLAKP